MAKALCSFRQRRWLSPTIDPQRQQCGHSLLPALPTPLVCWPLLPLQMGAWSNGYYWGKKRKNNIFTVTGHSPYSSHPSTARRTGRLIPSLSQLSPSLSSFPDLLLPAPVLPHPQTNKIQIFLLCSETQSVFCCLTCSPPMEHNMKVTLKYVFRFLFSVKMKHFSHSN